MFIYVNKSDDSIFYHTEGEVRTDDNMIYGPDQIIRKSPNSYTIYEVNGDDINLKYFTENKYRWDPEKEETYYAYPELEIQDKKRDIRAIRDPLLKQSDEDSGALWADRWSALDSDTRKAWIDYREELRNITDIEDLDKIEWPIYPLDKGGALNPLLEEPDLEELLSEDSA
jgi:hypothetical protein